MKSKIDTSHITNELREASLHFQLPSPTERKEEKKQTDLLANQQTRLVTNTQISKAVKKFGSYLREDSIKAIKRRAVEEGCKDYEILQEAVDLYFAKQDNI